MGYIQRNYRLLSMLSGPTAFGLVFFLAKDTFAYKGSLAIATTIWMALWWVLRPVNVSVTALIPIPINALFNLIPMNQIISQYFSEIIILLLGADIICLTWHSSGLDRRLSVKTLCLIGTSMKQQIAVWLSVATVLSMFLPNVVVCTILVPIAVSMLKFIGEEDIKSSKIAVPILLAIVWGAGIGGFGTPIGGAANLVAINYIEGISGHELMYVDWVVRFLPFLLVILALNLLFLFALKLPVEHINGTKSYFAQMYKELGALKQSEKISLGLFLAATLLSFARPLYAELLPGMKPAYVFFTLSLLTFILNDEQGRPLMDWPQAERSIMWGMLFLFAGGLALGRLVTETGATATIARLISEGNLTGGLGTVFVFTLFACGLSEISSNTAAAAITVPVVVGITTELGLDPIPYLLISIVAFNCAYILPVSIRAIPVGYGLAANTLLVKGAGLATLSAITITTVGYIIMKFWPIFLTL